MQTKYSRARRSILASATILASAAAAVVVFSAAPIAAGQTKDLEWSGELSPGATLGIHNVNGAIVADGAPGAHASAHIHVSSKSSDLGDVRLKVAKSSNGVVLCVDTARERWSDDCRHSHTIGDIGWNDSISVEFSLHVPHGVAFQTRNVNGRLTAHDMTADVDAKTVNGKISIATAGQARAKTVNGAIDARIESAGWPGVLDFSTVNGPVTVRLPRNASFSVHAKTVNGAIDASAFGLNATPHLVGTTLDGSVGKNDQGRSLDIKTVNGSVLVGTI